MSQDGDDFRISTINNSGEVTEIPVNYSKKAHTGARSDSKELNTIALGCTLLLVFLSIFMCIVVKWRKRRRALKKNGVLPMAVVDDASVERPDTDFMNSRDNL
jgi:hypothetical protein